MSLVYSLYGGNHWKEQTLPKKTCQLFIAFSSVSYTESLKTISTYIDIYLIYHFTYLVCTLLNLDIHIQVKFNEIRFLPI